MRTHVLQRIVKLGRTVRAKVAIYLLRLQYGTDGFPVDLRVAKSVRIAITDGGVARFARGSSIDSHATIVVKHGKLVVGQGVYIGIGSLICARDSISIGNDVLIAEYVTIRDQDHDFAPDRVTSRLGFSTAAIVIGNNVWLGAKATVTRGVTIGDNSVIGANSVGTLDSPPNVVAAGVPAQIVRSLRPDELLPESTTCK